MSEEMTTADVMSAEELYEDDQRAEYHLDAEQEARDAAAAQDEAAEAADECCTPELIDGTYYGCGDCPACDDRAADDEDAEEVYA